MPNAPTAAVTKAVAPVRSDDLAPAPGLGAGFLGFVIGATVLYLALRRARKETKSSEREN